MDGWKAGGWVDERVDGWADGWMNVWTDGWVSGYVDEWRGGWEEVWVMDAHQLYTSKHLPGFSLETVLVGNEKKAK